MPEIHQGFSALIFGRLSSYRQAFEEDSSRAALGVGGSVTSHVNAHDLVVEIVQKKGPAITNTTLLRDVDGWDSMHMVRLVLRLEEIVGRQLSEPELEALESVSDVARILGSE